MTHHAPHNPHNNVPADVSEQVQSLHDLIPHLRQLHASVNSPNVFQTWLEEMIEVKNSSH